MTDLERFFEDMPFSVKVDTAVAILRQYEPPGGYRLGDSGGKDSSVILWLARRAGVCFRAVHNSTTVDPPEVYRFLKEHHPETEIRVPPRGMFSLIARKGLPTRSTRWCCFMLKHRDKSEDVLITGVRAEESARRAKSWQIFDEKTTGITKIQPILYWSSEDVWRLIGEERIPVCSLYGEGFHRIGCVGCPLAYRVRREREFIRWPRYLDAYRKAGIRFWERCKERVLRRDGIPYHVLRHASGEDYFDYWRGTP